MNLLCLIRNRLLLNILFKSSLNWCILNIPSKMRIVYSFWVKQKVFKQGRVWCGCWVVQHSVEQTSSHQTGKQIPHPRCVHLHRGENGVHDDSAAGQTMPCSHFKHRIVGAGILSLLVNPFHLKNHYSADLPQPLACSPLKIFRFKFPLHKTWFTFWNFV